MANVESILEIEVVPPLPDIPLGMLVAPIFVGAVVANLPGGERLAC